MKKTVSLIVALVCILTAALPALANVDGMDASKIIHSCKLQIVAKPGGVVQATVSVNCLVSCSSLGANYIIIDEYQSGRWVPVASVYNDTGSGYNYGGSVTFTGATAGTQYRGRASVFATDGTTDTRYLEETATGK